MHQNLINQNPIVNQFNNYMTQNRSYVPFQGNQLINQNVHVMNNLNQLVQQHRNPTSSVGSKKSTINKSKETNVIEEIMKPQQIIKNNKDVSSNLKAIEQQRKEKIRRTNAPYKIIIKDKIITNEIPIDKFEKEVVVHKVTEKDRDINNFSQELKNKENEIEKIDDEIKVEFHIDNYSNHKKKFEYKETFIKNLAFEQKTFDENKQDYLEFYKQKQKELAEGQKTCDQILHHILDEGIIKKEELPTEETKSMGLDILPVSDSSSLNDASSNDVVAGEPATLNAKNRTSLATNNNNRNRISSKRINSSNIVNI